MKRHRSMGSYLFEVFDRRSHLLPRLVQQNDRNAVQLLERSVVREEQRVELGIILLVRRFPDTQYLAQ